MTTNHEDFFRHPRWDGMIRQIQTAMSEAKRPPSEVILDDVDLRALLKCSKRKTAELRANREITYSKSGKIYYYLSDVLNFINRGLVKANSPELQSRFK